MGKREKLKQDKKRLTRLSNESISISFFLSRVLGIRDNTILSRKLRHADIKELFPKLKRTSFDYIIDNPSAIYDGNVLLVEDSYGSVIPYINPMLLLEETSFYGDYSTEEVREELPNINDIELTEQSPFELQELLHIYDKKGIRSAYRKVREELVTRKDSRHASHESRERTLRKERKNERFDY